MATSNTRLLFQIPVLVVLPLAIVGCSDDPSPSSDADSSTTDVGLDSGSEADGDTEVHPDDDAEGVGDAENPSDTLDDVSQDTLGDADAGSEPESDAASDADAEEDTERDIDVDTVDDTDDMDVSDTYDPEPGSYLDRLLDAVTPILTDYCEEYVACTGRGPVADCVEDLIAESFYDGVFVWTPDCLDAVITYATCYFTDPECTTNEAGEAVLYSGDYCTDESYGIDDACEYTDDYGGYDDYKD